MSRHTKTPSENLIPVAAPADIAGATRTKLFASTWRADLARGASPDLLLLIARHNDLEQRSAAARVEAAAQRDAAPYTPPSDAQVKAAMDAVPVPEILRVPHDGRQLASVTWSDGSTVNFDLDTYRKLTPDEIDTHFEGDPEGASAAKAASEAYQSARNAAMRDCYKAAHTPESLEAERAGDAIFRTQIAPLYDAIQRVRAEIRAFPATSPRDRLAQILALFEMEGGKLGGAGKARNAEDAFEGPDGDKLASLVFAALAANADEHALRTVEAEPSALAIAAE